MRGILSDGWLLGLGVAFLVVVLVNVGFAVVAVAGADPVEQSYLDDPR